MSNPAFQAIAAIEFELDDLATTKDIIREFSSMAENGLLTENSLRYMLRERHNNGLVESGAVLEKGRHLIFVIPRFLKWFEVN